MHDYYFRSIILILLGISLIGTVSKAEIWNNSQNMFFGCIGGLISYFCGLPISYSIVITVICIIISCIIFKFFISKDIFIIKSEKLKNFILLLAVSIIYIAAISFDTYDLKTLIKSPIFVISDLVFIIFGIKGIPKFINYIQTYDLDEFEDGEIIYIDDGFFNKVQNSIQIYKDKKVYFESMHSIIDKKCIVQNIDRENIINFNGINYSIIEKNNEILRDGDIVKISKDNLNKGMIRKSNFIIVEKLDKKRFDY